MELIKVTTTTIKLNADLGGGVISATKTAHKTVTPIADKVKLTNMASQNARNKADKQAENFMRIAKIENKRDKKQNFFNKHKNK